MDEEDLVHTITSGITNIASGLQDCIWLNDLSLAIDAAFFKDASAGNIVTQQEGFKHLTAVPDFVITLRDFVRMCFFEIGIEIEFSGKNNNEKGVVIDLDEHKLETLKLKPDTLRFGQTVVRVNAL